METRKVPVLIDVDTGVDDALALILACGSTNIELLGATAVAGNVDLVHTARNTLNVLHHLGKGNVPVAKGADKPLERRLFKASGVHGLNGLRGFDFEQDATEAFVDAPAWDMMRDILLQHDEKVTIIALGPATNVAVLLDKYPEVKEKIDKIVFMGCAYREGNPTPVATFNVLVDPEAFRKVLFSGVDVYACPLDTTRKGYLTAEEVAAIGDIPGMGATFASALLGGYGGVNLSEEERRRISEAEDEEDYNPNKRVEEKTHRVIHDLITVAFVTNPELFTCKKYYCDVECKGELTTGWTLIDMADYYGKTEEEKNLYYIDSIDREGFVQLFYDTLKGYAR